MYAGSAAPVSGDPGSVGGLPAMTATWVVAPQPSAAARLCIPSSASPRRMASTTRASRTDEVERLGETDRASQLRWGGLEDVLRPDGPALALGEPPHEVLDPAVGHERDGGSVAGGERGIPRMAGLDVGDGGPDEVAGPAGDEFPGGPSEVGAPRHTNKPICTQPTSSGRNNLPPRPRRTQ